MTEVNGVTIPNLWPTEQIRVNVLSPVAILKMQAGLLSELTKGLLVGEVTTFEREQEEQFWIEHQFDIVAPALSGYRRRILRVTHNTEEAYPASIINDIGGWGGDAKNQDEFIDRIKGMLGSDQMLTIIHSLIARSNDVQPIDEAA